MSDSLSGPPVDPTQPYWKSSVPVRVPIDISLAQGESICTRGLVISAITKQAVEQNRWVVWANQLRDCPAWCEESNDFLCEWTGCEMQVLSIASVDDRRRWRVPTFIQDPDIPDCCGRPMSFVGQIDDNLICTDPPVGAELWWHDAASFYVFTCPICLECKAIGQQF